MKRKIFIRGAEINLTDNSIRIIESHLSNDLIPGVGLKTNMGVCAVDNKFDKVLLSLTSDFKKFFI